MATEEQNIEDRLICDRIFSHFKKHKVEISCAIRKTFPFLERLRDHEFITEKMFEDSQESCRNLVPVQRVVYNVLNVLEKNFNLEVLKMLFSNVHMKEYPDLIPIYKSFINVISSEDSEESNDGDKPPAVPLSPLESEPSEEVINVCDSSKSSETEEIQEATCSRPKIALGHDLDFSESSEDETPPKIWSSAPRSECGQKDPVNTRYTSAWRILKRKSPHRSSSLQCFKWISNSDTSELSHGEDTLDIRSSALRSGSGAELQRPEKEKCSCVMCFSSGEPRSQEATAESSQTPDMMDTTDAGNNSALEKHSRKRRRRRGRPRINFFLSYRCQRKRYQLRGRKRANPGPLKRRRVSRFPRDESMNFLLPELPVTCGDIKGILYKEKLKQGTSERCIKSETGRWFTLREFEVEGDHGPSKNWKLSIRCGGYTLKHLIENGHLPNTPRTRKKQRILKSHNNTLRDPCPENSNICVVCKTWGKLFCCDTCPRSFHENCHIPPVETERDPWSCIFCKIKVIQGRCPESQPRRQESEVLRMQMLPEEQLKCEFLLLKVYCDSKSLFFASKPYYSREGSGGPQRSMWLDKVKKTLTEKMYLQVKEFVGDVRLIFQNHKVFYRENKFITLGHQVENNFEKNFKSIFAIQETSKNNSQLASIMMLT
ncbi:nuclear autoantigen Sp-100 isoform X8 [Microcebus murinus]|uniref:nuclear autoantigen Sp-100 isoform X8 n=1 Tax=Microcebus murinus TaxID=30608 RepID=UPI003F6D05F1